MFRQLILISALAVLALAQTSSEEEEDNILVECEMELGYKLPPHHLRKTKKHNCMMKCMQIKLGLISEDGVLNIPRIQEKFNSPATRLQRAVEKCKDKTGDDECSKISNKMACIIEKIVTIM